MGGAGGRTGRVVRQQGHGEAVDRIVYDREDHSNNDGRERLSDVYSLNVPVSGGVKRIAADLFPRLVAFERVRERHAIVLKRFEEGGSVGSASGRTGNPDRSHSRGGGHELAALRERIRPVLAGTPAFEARITGIDCFEEPTRGSGPVVYLAVESHGLQRVHRRLVKEFGAVGEIEGEAYTPHVTLARGGSAEAARELIGETEIDPIEWTVSELRFFDPRYREVVGRVSLPL